MRGPQSKTAAFLGLMALVAPTPAPGDDSAFEKQIQPFLAQHCLKCHGAEKQKGRIRYDRIEGYQTAEQHLWTKVHEQLRTGEMPPEDRPRPSDQETEAVLSWIETNQRALHTASTRRLNRRELAAALQDLTGLSVDYAAGIPGDGQVNGFDTGAEALQDAGDSIAQIMEVTRRAVEGIRFLDASTEQGLVLDLSEELFRKDVRRAFSNLKDQGYLSKGKDAAGVPGKEFDFPVQGVAVRARWVGDRDKFSIIAPAPDDGRAVLRVSFTVAAWKPDLPNIPNPHLWVQVGGKTIDHREITNPIEHPQTLTYEVQLEDVIIEKGGVEVALRTMVEMPYAVEGFENEEKAKPEENIPGGTGLYRPKWDQKRVPWHEQPIPHLIYQRIEIDPNYLAAWPPAAWQTETGKLEDSAECAKRLLKLWLERAWRRPVSAKETQPFFAFYENLRRESLPFDQALRATFQSVLLSGPFRFLASPADEDQSIAQFAIASRLSFMLVGAPPDGELRGLAAAGKLRDPAVLDEQVDRLLADPRSTAFWEPFVTQWLVLEQPITLAMDHIKKQDFRFGRYLKASMREQTIAYVAQLFSENRPARELIDSNWTMMNNSLARHYEYTGIEGGELRKVNLRKDDPRGGGLLGHAGIQSMLCWMGDNWVIYRGAWAMRHILDDPPPPPPLEVPELDPSAGENKGKPMRELLLQHQSDPNCSVCHKKMDPLGFAFQNFDLSGRWREVEHERYHRYELDGKIEWRGEGKTRPTDAVGKLPRGEEFRSYAAFKEIVVQNYQPDLVRGLMKNLTLYGTGRQPDVADMATIREIMKEQEKAGYPLRDVLRALVRSEVFLGY